MKDLMPSQATSNYCMASTDQSVAESLVGRHKLGQDLGDWEPQRGSLWKAISSSQRRSDLQLALHTPSFPVPSHADLPPRFCLHSSMLLYISQIIRTWIHTSTSHSPDSQVTQPMSLSPDNNSNNQKNSSLKPNKPQHPTTSSHHPP